MALCQVTFSQHCPVPQITLILTSDSEVINSYNEVVDKKSLVYINIPGKQNHLCGLFRN